MDNQTKDTRLNDAELEAAVDFAYAGAAIRAGRKAQARTLARMMKNMFKSKPKAAQPGPAATSGKA